MHTIIRQKIRIVSKLSARKVLNKQQPLTLMGFLGGSVVKNLPAMQEMWVQSLGWEDPLKKEMVTHSSTLAREIP